MILLGLKIEISTGTAPSGSMSVSVDNRPFIVNYNKAVIIVKQNIAGF